MLRHVCGYKLANDGRDTWALQYYLGHKSIQHTVRYTKLSPDRFRDFWRDGQRDSHALDPSIYSGVMMMRASAARIASAKAVTSGGNPRSGSSRFGAFSSSMMIFASPFSSRTVAIGLRH
jgi:type 1 fimbriae regulatory protein FimB/type 1 fimbriae regulatory protein FimE